VVTKANIYKAPIFIKFMEGQKQKTIFPTNLTRLLSTGLISLVLALPSGCKQEQRIFENLGYGGYHYEKANGATFLVFYDKNGQRYCFSNGDRTFDEKGVWSKGRKNLGLDELTKDNLSKDEISYRIASERIRSLCNVYAKRSLLGDLEATKIEESRLPEEQKKKLVIEIYDNLPEDYR